MALMGYPANNGRSLLYKTLESTELLQRAKVKMIPTLLVSVKHLLLAITGLKID